jgi:hypothetical protein
MRLEAALAKATASVTTMIEAFSEHLITIDDLRARMPHREAGRQTCAGRSTRSAHRQPTRMPTSSAPMT